MLNLDREEAARREAQAILRLASEPRPNSDCAKSAIARAARALGLGYRRATSLWYGSARVSPAEAERLRLEAERLYQARLDRLRQDIAETERLLGEARRHNAALAAIDARASRDARQPSNEVANALGSAS